MHYEKKIIVFAGKFCSFQRRRYLCTTKPTRWIHLRVRIRASHARHRGSNPLSTTRLPNGRTQVRPFSVSSCRCRPSAVFGGGVTELRCRTARRAMGKEPGRKLPAGCCRAGIVSRNPSAGVRPPQTAGWKLPQPPHEGRLRLRFRLSVGWWVTFPVCL